MMDTGAAWEFDYLSFAERCEMGNVVTACRQGRGGEAMSDDGNTNGSHLENRLEALQALYRRYGRQGMNGQPAADVALLLAAKQMELRDGMHGREETPERQRERRQLELEVLDLHGYLDTQKTGSGLSGSPIARWFQSQQSTEPRQPKRRERGIER